MHGVSFKKRAPRAIKEIRGFAVKAMVGFICVFLFFRISMHELDGANDFFLSPICS